MPLLQGVVRVLVCIKEYVGGVELLMPVPDIGLRISSM